MRITNTFTTEPVAPIISLHTIIKSSTFIWQDIQFNVLKHSTETGALDVQYAEIESERWLTWPSTARSEPSGRVQLFESFFGSVLTVNRMYKFRIRYGTGRWSNPLAVIGWSQTVPANLVTFQPQPLYADGVSSSGVILAYDRIANALAPSWMGRRPARNDAGIASNFTRITWANVRAKGQFAPPFRFHKIILSIQARQGQRLSPTQTYERFGLYVLTENPSDAPVITVGARTGTSIAISWTAGTRGTTPYTIQWGLQSGGGYDDSHSTSDTSYTITGLSSSQTYAIHVQPSGGSEATVFAATT